MDSVYNRFQELIPNLHAESDLRPLRTKLSDSAGGFNFPVSCNNNPAQKTGDLELIWIKC